MTPFIKTYDNRLCSYNFIFEMTIEEYYNLIINRLSDNRYQRKRVKNPNSVYALLKKDLMEGCIMPPIVLAYEGVLDEKRDLISQLLNTTETILILDGLQRSYTITDLVEGTMNLFENDFSEFKNHKVRIELYTNINKTALLYRMLTLNTGQSRMSTRHQIEIIYSDYLSSDFLPDIKLLRSVDNERPSKVGEYSFRDVIEGFTSYLMEDYLLLDRMDILENIKELERLTNMQSNDRDMFTSFIATYTIFVRVMSENSKDNLSSIIMDESDDISSQRPKITLFGNNAVEIFNKSQSLTGFGNAVAKLKERGDIDNFETLSNFISNVNITNIDEGLCLILRHLEQIRPLAKKIGNDQRFYFYSFFKHLFDAENSQRDIVESAKKAWRMYEREYL